MSHRIQVNLSERSYDILIEPGISEHTGEILRDMFGTKSRFFFVTNPIVNDLYAQTLQSSLNKVSCSSHFLTVPDGEEYKNLETVSNLYDGLVDLNAKRNDVIIALGGGVIGDIAGFLAATFLRGLDFVQIPTTLLAQVDSSVGGKVGVNHKSGKNLIGSFYQPKIVIIDPGTLRTLSRRQLQAGLAEVIKYGCISEPGILEMLIVDKEKALTVDDRFLTEIIAKSCAIKAEVVEEDEKERGRRAILNYGHTIGHAIESATGYQEFLHGEAIMLGMIAAAWIAKELDLISENEFRIHHDAAQAVGLPVSYPDLGGDRVFNMMQYDKKWDAQESTLILLEGIGNPIIVKDVSDDLIMQALEFLKGENNT